MATATPVPTSARWNGASSRSSAMTRRSEEHTSELQSRQYLVCRLLLEKKNKQAVASVSILHISFLAVPILVYLSTRFYDYCYSKHSLPLTLIAVPLLCTVAHSVPAD